jgi:hypothetical protein
MESMTPTVDMIVFMVTVSFVDTYYFYCSCINADIAVFIPKVLTGSAVLAREEISLTL